MICGDVNSMGYNHEFEDLIDNINNIAKGYGFKNGIHWAKYAQQQGEITWEEYKKYENSHNLRNRYSHGNARDIVISYETYQIVLNTLNKIRSSNTKFTQHNYSNGTKLSTVPKRHAQIPENLYKTGLAYYKGDGYVQDFAKAASYYKLAAEAGNVKAQNNLGACYAKGKGVPQDFCLAIAWYKKAAEHGDSQAQFNLGNCYNYGWGVKMNKAEAVKYYNKSATQNNKYAYEKLGDCYYYGYGVDRNYYQALKYYKLSVKYGNDKNNYKDKFPFI